MMFQATRQHPLIPAHPSHCPLQMRTVAQVGGHNDDVNAVAYAEREAPNVIFSGSDDTFVKVGNGRACPRLIVCAASCCCSSHAAGGVERCAVHQE